MIERLKIQNYKCLRNVDIPLRPLSVFIGRNNTGKSACLDAIARILGNPGGGIEFKQEEFWQFDLGNSIDVAVTAGGQQVRLQSQPGKVQCNWMPNPQNAKHILHDLTPVATFRLPFTGPCMTSEGIAEGKPLAFGPQGEGVAAVLDAWLRRDRKRFEAVCNTMAKLTPGLATLNVETPHSKSRRVDMVTTEGMVIPGQQLSAGIKLILFFVTLAHHSEPPRTILVEEPESGVHPQRLGEVMTLMRELTEGIHGRPVQVVLTTHSPYLLDWVNLDSDEVVVFREEHGDARSARAVDRDRLKHFLDEFMLGEVWVNESEGGLVGN